MAASNTPRGALVRGSRSMFVGVALLAIFVAAAYVAVIAARGMPFRHYTYVKAAFKDVGPLRVGDDVRVNSVRVGQVSHLAYDGMQAVVTMQLDGRRQVYRDAGATVAARSALGQKFVNLAPGHSTAGPLGTRTISADRTGDARDIDYLLDALDSRTRLAAAGTLREVGGGLAGHSADLHDFVEHAPDLLNNLGTVSQAASSDNSELIRMLQSADTLAGRFAGRQQQIAALIRQVDDTVGGVAVDGGAPLRQTLARLPGTLRQADASFDSLDQPLAHTESAMRALRPGTQALGRAAADVRGVLRESVVPLDKVPSVARQADPALNDLTTTLSDARPLIPALAESLARARTPLEVLSPYAPEVALWFTYARDSLADGDGTQHWLRFDVPVNTESVSGGVPARDPVTRRDPYPAPGEADHDRNRLPARSSR